MHIDEEVLARVMKWSGAKSKTETVAMALKEMDRKTRLAEFGEKGLGFTPEELKAAVDPDYDLLSLRVADLPVKYRTQKKK